MTSTLSMRSVLALGMALAAGAVACGGAIDETSTRRSDRADTGGTATSAPWSGPSGSSAATPLPSPPSSGSSTPPPAPRACCPADPAPSGSMMLGGVWNGNPCAPSSDFWCSVNWRLEADGYGCPLWKYDIRKPAPDENQYCQVSPKSCSPGNHVFCRCPDGSGGVALCKADGTPDACGPCD